jgi:hypothetical protein
LNFCKQYEDETIRILYKAWENRKMQSDFFLISSRRGIFIKEGMWYWSLRSKILLMLYSESVNLIKKNDFKAIFRTLKNRSE